MSIPTEPDIQDSGAIQADSINDGAVTDIRQQLEAIELHYELGRGTLGVNSPEVVAQLLALISQTVNRTEKAYGGCHRCYGKGYSTWRHGETYRGSTHNLRDEMKFCTCDRGQQLEGLLGSDV